MKLHTYIIATAFMAVGLPLAAAQVHAAPVKLSVTPGYSSVVTGTPSVMPVKVSLEGVALPERPKRPQANVALVIDRSGSMNGQKIEQARAAARAAIESLSHEDILSIVAYESSAEVLLPATRLTDKASAYRAVERIVSDGETALFAGVSLAAAEVAKFRDANSVNRIILISDGLANVGPSSPAELGKLGESLRKEGIAVSTIGLGLGYNEDLMTRLARTSDGNHHFAEHATQLASIFSREFADVFAVVAQNVSIEVQCPEGIRPLRVLGRNADIYGNTLFARLNQVYQGQEKYIVFEVEVNPAVLDQDGEIANVTLKYWDPVNKREQAERESGRVSKARSRIAMNNSVDRPTIAAYYSQIAAEASEEAIRLADQGKKAAAIALIGRAAAQNEAVSRQLGVDDELMRVQELNSQIHRLREEPYEKARKQLKFENYGAQTQQFHHSR